MGLVNDILNAGIFAGSEPPRDSWSLGTVSGEPAAGLVDVILDGDVAATSMPYAAPCVSGDRVLTLLLGRSRLVVANLANPATAILAALLTVDGTGSALDADTLDGSHASALAAETTTTIGALINGATAKTTPVDADQLGLMDSAASGVLKKLSWANAKATLKTYFDTFYSVQVIKTGTLTVNGAGQKSVVVAHGLDTPTNVMVTLGYYSLGACIIDSVRGYISGSYLYCAVNVSTYVAEADIPVTFLVFKQ